MVAFTGAEMRTFLPMHTMPSWWFTYKIFKETLSSIGQRLRFSLYRIFGTSASEHCKFVGRSLNATSNEVSSQCVKSCTGATKLNCCNSANFSATMS
uniref:Uncharacterized protein n=1 Tax=Choristoneura fumiferana nuclear polyhedrosis virus TaxID=208973 RepID=Q6LCC6_NPVCF|nr:unknown [Choristoneura fumiferana multiple nucleopolyhedrovirus]